MPSTSTAPASQPAPVGRGTLLTSTGVPGEHSTALTTGELGAGSTTGTVPSGSRPVGPTRRGALRGLAEQRVAGVDPGGGAAVQRLEHRAEGVDRSAAVRRRRVVGEVVGEDRVRHRRPGRRVGVVVQEATADEPRAVAAVVAGDRRVADRHRHLALAGQRSSHLKGGPASTVAADVDVLQAHAGGVAVHVSGIGKIVRPPVNNPVLPWIGDALERGVGAPALDGEAAEVVGHDHVVSSTDPPVSMDERAPELRTVVRRPDVDESHVARRRGHLEGTADAVDRDVVVHVDTVQHERALADEGDGAAALARGLATMQLRVEDPDGLAFGRCRFHETAAAELPGGLALLEVEVRG